MINNFELVKQIVTPKQVATKYLGSPARWGNTYMYKSPFRNEKTPSFAVNDTKGFTDFASGWHSDMFGFVKELFNIKDRYEAMKVIVNDFNIAIGVNTVSKKEYVTLLEEKKVNKILENGLDVWFDNMYDKLCKRYREVNKVCNKFRRSRSKKCIYKINSKLFTKELILESIIDEFLDCKTDEDKLQLFRQRKELNKVI
jgi:hypothetical protein